MFKSNYKSQTHRFVYPDKVSEGHIVRSNRAEYTLCGLELKTLKKVGIPMSRVLKFRERQPLCQYCQANIKNRLKKEYEHLKDW
jgi:hypothetical protein